ncbi:thioredoxin family protein [Pseudomonas sp. RIT-PI-AD]|uniref:thioredoxin family protein n=1 Tax=Pseudomonas sp. RIT-PI-AD TaxID=3035294 RepID=UPI0021DB4EEE|nr:thioredoxin family protein [Pseudomonas sp. RIT-PI-AD]
MDSVPGFELSDFDADRRLLDWRGVSLVVFTSQGCSRCRWARQVLPRLRLPVQRLCWIDAGDNGGLVERYEVLQLPALFLVREGRFLGALPMELQEASLIHNLAAALQGTAEELP